MEQKLIFSVSQLNELVKMTLESQPLLEHVYVRGEISNFTNHYKTGHFYFSIKDEKAALKCVMFSSNALRCRFKPENGMRVLVCGKVSAFVRDGQYQLYVENMEPDGIGSLALAYAQLKDKLAKEGLFDSSRKRPLPPYPKHIGIITSPTGAAVRDIIHIATRRFPGIHITLYPTLVQGEGAAKQLCAAIRYFNNVRSCDIIILGRGGGSLEDLWAFNDETLARQIANSEIPVISAVGHETDFTICDFVADLRAPTPSAAAELAVPDTAALRLILQKQNIALQGAIAALLRVYRLRLAQLSQNRCLASPAGYIDERRMELDHFVQRLYGAQNHILLCKQQPLVENAIRLQNVVSGTIKEKQASLTAAAAKLHALSPLAVMQRGFSITKTKQGKILRNANEVACGDEISVQLAHGRLQASVQKVIGTKEGEKDDGTDKRKKL